MINNDVHSMKLRRSFKNAKKSPGFKFKQKIAVIVVNFKMGRVWTGRWVDAWNSIFLKFWFRGEQSRIPPTQL